MLCKKRPAGGDSRAADWCRGMLRLMDFPAEGIGPETLGRLVDLGAAASRSSARRQGASRPLHQPAVREPRLVGVTRYHA